MYARLLCSTTESFGVTEEIFSLIFITLLNKICSLFLCLKLFAFTSRETKIRSDLNGSEEHLTDEDVVFLLRRYYIGIKEGSVHHKATKDDRYRFHIMRNIQR